MKVFFVFFLTFCCKNNHFSSSVSSRMNMFNLSYSQSGSLQSLCMKWCSERELTGIYILILTPALVNKFRQRKGTLLKKSSLFKTRKLNGKAYKIHFGACIVEQLKKLLSETICLYTIQYNIKKKNNFIDTIQGNLTNMEIHLNHKYSKSIRNSNI